MSQQTTIRKLAELVNTPVEKLLEQLAEAGMSVSGPDQVVTSIEKVKLLGFLKRAHGKADQGAKAKMREAIGRRKLEDEYARFLREMRGEAFVEMRLQKSGVPDAPAAPAPATPVAEPTPQVPENGG